MKKVVFFLSLFLWIGSAAFAEDISFKTISKGDFEFQTHYSESLEGEEKFAHNIGELNIDVFDKEMNPIQSIKVMWVDPIYVKYI